MGEGEKSGCECGAGELLVMWVLVRGKVLVLVVRLVVVQRRVAGPADVACL